MSSVWLPCPGNSNVVELTADTLSTRERNPGTDTRIPPGRGGVRVVVGGAPRTDASGIGETLGARARVTHDAGAMRRFRLPLLAFGCAAVALSMLASPAHAGTYTVYACKTPSGAVAPTSEWLWRGNSTSMTTGSSCPGGYLWMDLAPVRHLNIHAAQFLYTPPPDTQIAAYTLYRSMWIAPGTGFYYSLYEVRADGEFQREVCIGCGGLGTAWNNFSDPDNRFARPDARGVDALRLVIGCTWTECAAVSPSAQFQLHRSDITLRDDYVPQFTTAPTGPLVAPGATLTGVVPVSVALADRGGGLRLLEVEVDGRVVQSVPLGGAGCTPPHMVSVPCPPSANLTVPVDTARWPDGAHQVRLIARDATTQNAAAWGPFTARSRNATCATAPVVRETKLSARLRRRGARAASRGRRVLRIGRRQRAVVSGRLSTPQGQPIAGAALCAVARGVGFRRNRVQVLGTTATDARGRYRIVVPPGASRRIAVVHRTAAGANVARARVEVPASVELAVPRTVETWMPIRLRGRAKGLGRGATVDIQVRQPGRWQTFKSPEVDRRGRFSAGYAFRTPGTYRLRAHVGPQYLSPYAPGASRSRLITAR